MALRVAALINFREIHCKSSVRTHNTRWRSTLFLAAATVLLVSVCSAWQDVDRRTSSSGSRTAQACVYEDHLVTDQNWYGFLANVTVMTTGRLTFEFVYPADKCCQNVLFYTEDQMAVISARMNCWQKEYPLRPEDDQILRLTPRFSWSGCHMTRPNNVATYVCKGGRSFTVDQQRQRYRQRPHHRQHHDQSRWTQQGQQQRRRDEGTSASSWHWRRADDHPTTWYIAASNCASLHGLDLRYRMEVFGHVGECRAGSAAQFAQFRPDLSQFARAPSPQPVLTADDADRDTPKHVSAADSGDDDTAAAGAADDAASCVEEGEINTTEPWIGIGNGTLVAAPGDAGFRFEFSFPYSTHSFLEMLIYGDEDQARLQEDDSCWHKYSIIPAAKVVELSERTNFNGCTLKNTTAYGKSVVCRGERRLIPGPAAAVAAAGPSGGDGDRNDDGSVRTVFVAISNCRVDRLVLRYRVVMYGFVCSGAAARTTATRQTTSYDGSLASLIVDILARPLTCLSGIAALTFSSTFAIGAGSASSFSWF